MQRRRFIGLASGFLTNVFGFSKADISQIKPQLFFENARLPCDDVNNLFERTAWAIHKYCEYKNEMLKDSPDLEMLATLSTHFYVGCLKGITSNISKEQHKIYVTLIANIIESPDKYADVIALLPQEVQEVFNGLRLNSAGIDLKEPIAWLKEGKGRNYRNLDFESLRYREERAKAMEEAHSKPLFAGKAEYRKAYWPAAEDGAGFTAKLLPEQKWAKYVENRDVPRYGENSHSEEAKKGNAL